MITETDGKMIVNVNGKTMRLIFDKEIKDLFRPLTEEEYKAKKNSIKKVGQLHPVLVAPDGLVLSGYHTLQMCKELGIEPYIKTVTGPTYNLSKDEALKIAFDVNFQGRKYDNDYNNVIAALKANYKNLNLRGPDVVGLEYGRQKEVLSLLPFITGISKRSVQRFIRIRNAIEEKQIPLHMEELLISGKISLGEAYEIQGIINDVYQEINFGRGNGPNFPYKKELLESVSEALKTIEKKEQAKKLKKDVDERLGHQPKAEVDQYEHDLTVLFKIITKFQEKHKDKLRTEEDTEKYEHVIIISYSDFQKKLTKERQEEHVALVQQDIEEEELSRKKAKEDRESQRLVYKHTYLELNPSATEEDAEQAVIDQFGE
jgi:hypothetical protein